MRRWVGLLALTSLAGCQGETDEPASPLPQVSPEAAQVNVPDTTAGTIQPPNPEPTSRSESASSKQVACSASEETIFSCTVESGKQLAVCAGEEGAEYRFGSGTSELTLSDGRWASVPYSGGGEAQIAFDNGDTRYIVFSRVVRTNFSAGEPNNPAISDGVLVERSGKTVAKLACGGEGELMTVQYFAAEKHLPEADGLFTNE